MCVKGLMCKHLTYRSNWNLEMLVFMEGGKPEYPEKNPRSKDENQQQSQPAYDTGTGNRTRATLVEGECSHHCATPATPNPPGARRHGSGATLQNLDLGTPSAMKYLWPKLWNTLIPEQNAITLPSRANNNLNSPSTALSALSPCN